MWRKFFLWFVLPLLSIVLIAFAWSVWYFYPDAERVSDFIKKHKDKAALCVIWNDKLMAQQNADTIMPLASTVKIMIAAEFSRQAMLGAIDTAEWIDTLELDKFYLADTDGGAHQEWLKHCHENKLLSGGKVTLMEVAKGMILFSSNANSAFLMNKLTLDSINKFVENQMHGEAQNVYSFVGALMVLQNTKQLEPKIFLMQTDTISQDRYVYLCNAAHDKLTNEQGYKKTFKSGDLDMKIQHIWSNRLPGASAKAYCRWMNDFNMKRIFSDTPSEHVLRALLEQDAQSHTTKGLKHMGYKGGSTAFVLTLAAYATDKQNNSGALAVFFNNLGALENMRLQMSLHEFKDKIFSDSLFRHKIEEEFNKPH